MGRAQAARRARLGEGGPPPDARGGPAGPREAPAQGLEQLPRRGVARAPPNLPLLPDGPHLFRAGRPNELWVTGITEFRLPSGERRYLSPAIDCLGGRPVSWSVGPRPTAALAPGEAPVVHSDRGCHYRWPGWMAPCREHGLARSMSRKGTSGDNARVEGL